MCSERHVGLPSGERPVDRPEACYCLLPELVQMTLKRIQILSFEVFTGGGPNAGKCSRCMPRLPKEVPEAA